jgi:outer membrane protein TolC
MKKFLIFLGILIFTLPQSAIAQEVRKIDLQTAVNIAVTNNIDIESAQMDVDIAKNSVKAANRLQNPDFNMFYNLGSAGRGNPQTLGFTQTVEVLKRGARKKMAKAALQLTKENTALSVFGIKMDVRQAYVSLVAAKSILNCLEQQQQLLEELMLIAQKRVDAGAAPEIEVIQAKIALNQMITEVNSARADVKSALFDFNKALNPKNNPQTLFDTEDELLTNSFIDIKIPDLNDNFPGFDSISENTLEKRFDIKIAQNGVEVAKKNLVTVARQRIPDLQIQGGYGYQPKNYSEQDRYLSGGYVGASLVNLPFFYNYSPEIKNAKIQVEQAQLNLTSTRNKALNDLHSAYEQLVTAKINVNYYNDKLLKDSGELIRISKKSYEVGKTNITSLIVMEQAYRSIAVGYTGALTDYYDCWIDFLRQVNTEEFELIKQDVNIE